jgi:hypothetical protein
MSTPAVRPPPVPTAISVARRAAELIDKGDPRAALALASRALRDGDHATLRLVRARALLAFRADEAAGRDLTRCLELAPRTVTALQLLCELALRRGDLAVAEIFLRDALALAPEDKRNAELGVVIRGWRRGRTGEISIAA